MKPLKTLPPDYHKVGTLDLRTNRRALVLLNIFGALLLVLSGLVFLQIGLWLRPEAASRLSFQITSPAEFIRIILALLAIIVVMLVVHEAIHGVFFWLFTGSPPAFGIGAGYAYATAPGWYLPRNQYLLIGLAPLVIISLGGLALIPVAPVDWFLSLLALVCLNISGAVGDLAVAGWLLTQPPTCLAQDHGAAITLYRPG